MTPEEHEVLLSAAQRSLCRLPDQREEVAAKLERLGQLMRAVMAPPPPKKQRTTQRKKKHG